MAGHKLEAEKGARVTHDACCFKIACCELVEDSSLQFVACQSPRAGAAVLGAGCGCTFLSSANEIVFNLGSNRNAIILGD